MTVKPGSKKLTPEAQLRACIERLDPKIQKLFRSIRSAVRKRFPTANELAYDYSFALVIGYALADSRRSRRRAPMLGFDGSRRDAASS